MDASATPLKAAGPEVLIVLLNWNDAEATLTALDSVLHLDYPAFRVLVVDNGSTDGSAAALEKVAGGRVEFIRSAENTGYTGGCNLGLQRGQETGAEYVWLLNNDAVVDSGTLSALVSVAENDPRIGLVTPRIASRDEPPVLTFAGAAFVKDQAFFDITADVAVAERWELEHPKHIVAIGTALLVPVRLVRAIGVLDAPLFAYWEDIDYSVRSMNAGFQNVVVKDCTVFHTEKQPILEPLTIKPHFWYYRARNETFFWRRHIGWSRSLRPVWRHFHRFLGHLGRCAESPVSCQAILAGLWHGWIGKRGVYDPRCRMPSPVASLVMRYARRQPIR